jgi:hypothetical protein
VDHRRLALALLVACSPSSAPASTPPPPSAMVAPATMTVPVGQSTMFYGTPSTPTNPPGAFGTGTQFIECFLWTLTSSPPGSTAQLQSANGSESCSAQSPSEDSDALTPDVPGTYTVQLVVGDNLGQMSGPTKITITALPCAPLLAPTDAITGTTIQDGLSLDVSVTEPCLPGATYQFAWTLLYTNGSTPTFTKEMGDGGDAKVDVTVTATDTWNDLLFELTATDNEGHASSDVVQLSPGTGGH